MPIVWIYIIIISLIQDRGKPVIMVPNAVMGNILLFWIPIVFCPKVIWRRSEQNCKGRGRMLSGAPTVHMSRFPMCKKPSTMP